MDFRIDGGADLSVPFSSRVCVMGFFRSLSGAWSGMGPVVYLSSGNLFWVASCVAALRNEVFLFLSLGSQ